MTEEIEKHLVEVLLRIERVESYFIEIKNFEGFNKNEMAYSAVERHLFVIGEALNNINKKANSIIVTDIRKIIGLRNLLAHAYDSIEPVQLYGIVKNHLPKLKSEILELLKNPS